MKLKQQKHTPDKIRCICVAYANYSNSSSNNFTHAWFYLGKIRYSNIKYFLFHDGWRITSLWKSHNEPYL